MFANLSVLWAQSDAYKAGAAAGSICFFVFFLAFAVVMIAAGWRVFEKAGKPGWAAIIPIYNTIVLLEIAGKPIWWIFLMLIPFVNIVIAILVMIDLAKNFGKGAGFAVGLILLPFIFFPILGFGSAEYDPYGEGRPKRRRRRRREYDDEDDDRPRKRRRDYDEDDEDRPRKRRRGDEFEDEDRPRRPRRPDDRIEDEDRPRRPRRPRDEYDD
jgi:hypothetical protein